MDSTDEKVCKHCGIRLSLELFHRDRSLEDGRSKTCRECYEALWGPAKREYARQWRKQNLERARQKDRERSGSEHRREQDRKYRERHRSELRKRNKAYREANWSKCYATTRSWILRHPDQQKAYKHRFYETHKDQYRERQRRRRECLVDDLAQDQDGRCAYCALPLGLDSHVDHRVPISRGGTDDRDNLCLACPSCNMRKYNKTPEEFLATTNQ